MWNPSDQRAKTSKQSARERFLPLLATLDPQWDDASKRCVTLASADHGFDAMIAAFVAWARAEDMTIAPDKYQMEPARVEGWIRMPLDNSWPPPWSPDTQR